VEMTFAILSLVFGIIGCSLATVCMVKINNMQKLLEEKGIAQ
jgi:ABC-type lipoprotein release transport system permease subunit